MNILFLLFTGFAIGISGAMIPGPLTLFIVSATLKTNKFAGFIAMIGHIAVEFMIIAIIFFGLHMLLTSRIVLITVSIVGGIAFIVMGALLFSHARSASLANIKRETDFERGLIIGGVFFSLASPGFLIWWATIGVSTVVRASLLGIIGIIVLAIGHWLADIVWYGILSFAIDKGKVYLSDRIYRNCIRFLSFLLVMLGINFILMARIY